MTLILRALVLALWLPVVAGAELPVPEESGQEAENPGGGEVELTADTVRYDRKADRVEAEGNVTVTRGETWFRADRMTWERTTGLITGEGNITGADGSTTTLSAGAIRLTAGEWTGEIIDGDLTLDGRYHMQGRLIRRLTADTYRIERGEFSTCPCEEGRRRPWSVTARSISARRGGTLVARGFAFRIKEVPVLYLPVFVFPTSSRQSGLLIPELGSDTRDGIRLEQPLYWVISPSQDLTLTYLLRSKRGAGGELWYRYMPSGHSAGEFRVSGLKDRSDGRVKGEAHWRHTTRPQKGWSFHADLNAVNDKDFFRDISAGTEVRTLERLESNLFAARSGRRGAVTFAVRRTLNLLAAGDTTVQHLPRLRLEAFDRRLGPLPFWLGAHLDGVYLYRETGGTSSRFDGGPRLTVRIPLAEGRVSAVARGAARVIWYGNPSPGGRAVAEAYPVSVSLGTRLTGRMFGRTHVVSPRAEYRFVQVNPADVTGFDQLERLGRIHEAVFRLNQRIGRTSWRIAVPYDLDDGRGREIRSELERLMRGVLLHADTVHESDTGRIARAVADTSVGGRRARLTVAEVYDRGTVGIGTPLFADTVFGEPSGQRTHYSRGILALGPWGGWNLSGQVDYDHRDNRPAEVRYGLGYLGTCWFVDLDYIDLPDRNLVRFRIGLVGAGGDDTPVTRLVHPLLPDS